MAAKCTVLGLQPLLRKLKKLNEVTKQKVSAGLAEAGGVLLSASKDIVPRQTGNLAGSGFVRSGPVDTSGIRTTRVGYTAAYAVFVHEDLTKAHGKDFNVKHADEIANPNRAHTVKSGNFNRGDEQQAKFLERPMRDMRKELLEIVARKAELKPEDLA